MYIWSTSCTCTSNTSCIYFTNSVMGLMVSFVTSGTAITTCALVAVVSKHYSFCTLLDWETTCHSVSLASPHTACCRWLRLMDL
jgi:hypothetical protein